MKLSYFDSSVLLAILLDERRKDEAFAYWQDSIRVSSILLKIETIITIRRIFESQRNQLGGGWLKDRTEILAEFLNEVNYRIIDGKLEREIYLKNELSRCRTLDAIHMATALQFRELAAGGEMWFYTFDKDMHQLARHFRFRTNKL